MIKVAVLGAHGRMGTAACAAIAETEDMELVASIGRGDSLEDLEGLGIDVAVDLTLPDVVMGNIQWCLNNGVRPVVGVSGFDKHRLGQVEDWLEESPELSVAVIPNFSIGAVLMMSFAATAAKYFPSAEIIEAHHPRKVDAPSGTAAHTARLIAAARAEANCPPMPDATEQSLPGARGAEIDGIPVHAIRSAGYVASQQVWFGGAGERLVINHDSTDRGSFMPGVLLSVREVMKHQGLSVGLDAFLN